MKAIREGYAPRGPVPRSRPVPKAWSPPPSAVTEPAPSCDDIAFETYWESLSGEQQAAMESDAVQQAEAFLFRQYHATGQGSLFEAVRQRILRNHWTRQRATGAGVVPVGRPTQ